MDIIELLKNLGIFGIIVTASAWLIREYAKQLFSKDIEKFKFELQKEAIELKIRYEKLHIERAEVIKKFYKQMVSVTRKINLSILTLEYEEKGKGRTDYKQIIRGYDDFVHHYEENALYFEDNIQKNIKELTNALTTIFSLYSFLKFDQEMTRSNKTSERMSKLEFDSERERLKNDMNTDISLIKKQIEQKFKNIIGIKDK